VDFTPGEAETEAARLAAQILSAAGTAGHPATVGPAGPADLVGSANTAERTDFDPRLWKELAGAGLLSLAVPEQLGGDGLGMQVTAAVLTEVGRHAAGIPALASLALGVLPVARCTDTALQRRLLAGVASGDTVLTAAIREPSDPLPDAPAATLTAGSVSGVKIGVPYAAAASWILVPASTPAGAVVVVVEPDSDGLSCQRTRSSSGLPEYTVRLEHTPVLAILEGCPADTLRQLAVAGACAVADGALAAALDLTSRHVRAREQFGRPLATFQAVAQQIADVYAAARTLHLATASVCWRLDNGRDAAYDADVAAYWLAEYAPPALRTCHHLHGGLGMDMSYPLPRYSALVTDLVSFVGGADAGLDHLARRDLAHPEQPIENAVVSEREGKDS
jgi:3-oxo-4-pregnene-20-carboxyl-CoA dehydrogenase alpha subunit